MDVLNKFYSTVSSTVSQLSGVLPGNPVTREYEVTNHIASAGPGLLWKVYSGYKKSTKQSASIFVFEKRAVVPQDKELVIDTLKRGVAQLTKLRHPQILVVQHPLEESRDCLAFATEPVFSSLANVLGKTDNMPANKEHVTSYKLFDVEIKYGLLQVGEGLAFLHKDAKMLHHNLCPSSIIINQQGAWKIFGFDFSVQNVSTEAIAVWPFIDYRKLGNEMTQPELEYLAPECGLSETQGPPSDIFSLGMLIFAVHNSGQPLVPLRDFRAYNNYISQLKALSMAKLQCVPEGLREMVRMMLNTTPEVRPDEHEFIKMSYFDDVGVKALNYLDSLFQWDNRQKSHFYKGLPQILDKLPHRVSLYRVIPCLVKEFVNPVMVPFVLPSVFAISENCTKQEFNEHILPHLKPVMQLQEPIQILLLVMQKMELVLKLTGSEDVKSDVLPVLYRALESDSHDIQELCLSVLPQCASLIEYPAMKNALLPRIKRLCISTSSISVRVNCLVCVGKLLDHLDKWLVLDEVIPFLPQIPSKEPAVLMGILGIYKLVLTHKKMSMSKELMATKVVPFLMPLSVENSLTLNQFNSLISLVKDMVNRVETEHRAKLEQLHAMQNEHKSLENSLSETVKMSSGRVEAVGDFESLFGGTPPPRKENPPPAISPPAPSANSSPLPKLTFQEKQRLMAEGDAARQLQSAGGLLTPKPASSSKPNYQVKDLTATLLGPSLNLNLNGNKAETQAKSGVTGWTSPQTPKQHAQLGVGGSSHLPDWGAPPTTLQHVPQQPQWGALQQAQHQPQWGPTQPQWGALQQVSMPQWGGGGLLNSRKVSASSSNGQAKPLSSSEINDFLS